MRRALSRLINVFRRERIEEDLEREVTAHLALLEDDYRSRGMTAGGARLAARRALGGVAHAQDQHRDARSFVWLDDLRRDLSHAARSLRRTPGFTAVAVLTLTLGIGATTATYSVISAVLLRPLPYADADRLVVVFAPPSSNPIVARRRREPSMYPLTFDALRHGTRALSDVAGYVLMSATLTGQGDAVRLSGVQASASLFRALGVTPHLGRFFTGAEEVAGSDAVVVLSHAAWQRYFHADRRVVGRVIALDGKGRTVVGVASEDFAFPDPTVRFWTPYVLPAPKAGSFISPAVVARLRDGVTREAAEADVNAVLQDEGGPKGGYELSGVQDDLVASVKPALLILTAAVRGGLVAAEVAMAMVLLVGGGLLVHSLIRLATAERGYDPSHVLTFQASGRQSGPQARALAEQVVDRMASLPGVTAAGYANNLPLVQQGFGRDVSPQPPSSGQRPRPQPGLHAVSPRFIAAMGMRLIEGRGFSDGEAARHEALVTRAFARSSFFDGPALGSHIYTERDDWQVVGILEDLNQFSLQQTPNPELFVVDFLPPPPGLGGTYFAVRASSDPAALAGTIRAVVRQLDPSATVDNIATMDQIVSNAMSRPRLFAALLRIFAAVAAALAAIGIYGVLAFVVTHRTREIGIRVALGARNGQVMALILRETAVLTLIGVIVGLAGAAVLSRYLEGLLFGVTPLDPPTFVAVVMSFAAVAVLASCVPARRATRVAPQVALRAE